MNETQSKTLTRSINPTEKVLLFHLWLRFAALWLTVVLIGFVERYVLSVLLPFGLASFLGAVFLTAFVVWRVARTAYVESWEADAGESAGVWEGRGEL